MVRKVDEIHISIADATALFPNSYILMRREDVVSDKGVVLYEGDTEEAVYEKYDSLNEPGRYVVLEGLSFHKNSIGGVCIEWQ